MQGFFSEEKLFEINKKFSERNRQNMSVFNEPLYLSIVVTPKQRAIIQDALNKCKGKTLTEQLLCLIKKVESKQKKKK